MKYLLIFLFLFSTHSFSGEECPNSPLKQNIDEEDDSPNWDECIGTYYKVNGDKYIGEWKNGKMYGYGDYIWSDGTSYKGNWLNDSRQGQAIMNFNDKRVWEGIWCDNIFTYGKKYDVNGVYKIFAKRFTISNGKFEGEVDENCHPKKGKFFINNGNTYEGQLKRNLPHGYGTTRFGSRYKGGKFFQHKYIGEHVRGTFDGRGKYIFPDGRVWIGTWESGNFKEGRKYAKGETIPGELQIHTIEQAKATCLDIGFKEKTEKFGECVVELYKGMSKTQTTTNTNEELLEIEKRRLAIEEDKASRDKWGNIGKALRDLSKPANNNSSNNNSGSSTCYSECRTSNPNATIQYCKRICRF